MPVNRHAYPILVTNGNSACAGYDGDTPATDAVRPKLPTGSCIPDIIISARLYVAFDCS